MLRVLSVVWVLVVQTMIWPCPSIAQNIGVVQSEVLVLDPEKLFAETKYGQRLNSEYLAARDELISRNRKIEKELEAQELELTNLRSEKTPAEFRQLADEFDARVQEIRRDSERAVRDLERSRERAPVQFMQKIETVLVQLMRDSGGAVIMDVRSVLLRADVIDITDLAVIRVNAAIGDGLEEPVESGTLQE